MEQHGVCYNSWDVQSKHIQSVDGIAESLYSGGCRYGGGEAYVLDKDPNDRVSATLYAAYGTKWNGNSGAYNGDNFAYTPVCFGADIRNGKLNEEVNGTLQAKDNGGWNANTNQVICYGIGSYDSNAWKSSNPHSGVYVAETARTLDALQCGYPACNQGGTAIVEAKE